MWIQLSVTDIDCTSSPESQFWLDHEASHEFVFTSRRIIPASAVAMKSVLPLCPKSIIELCVLQEFLMRIATNENRDNKVWFLNAIQFILSS